VPLLHHLVEPVDARGRLLGHALDHVALLDEPAGRFRHPLADLGEEVFLLFARRHGDEVGLALLHPRAHEHVERRVPAVVEDHVAPPLGEAEDHVGVVQ
jgi:hypothetical protein